MTNCENYPFDYCETIESITKTDSIGKLSEMGKICKCNKEFVTYAFFVCVKCYIISYLRYETALYANYMMEIYGCNCNMDKEFFSYVGLTRIQKLKLIKQLTNYSFYT